MVSKKLKGKKPIPYTKAADPSLPPKNVRFSTPTDNPEGPTDFSIHTMMDKEVGNDAGTDRRKKPS